MQISLCHVGTQAETWTTNHPSFSHVVWSSTWHSFMIIWLFSFCDTCFCLIISCWLPSSGNCYFFLSPIGNTLATQLIKQNEVRDKADGVAGWDGVSLGRVWCGCDCRGCVTPLRLTVLCQAARIRRSAFHKRPGCLFLRVWGFQCACDFNSVNQFALCDSTWHRHSAISVASLIATEEHNTSTISFIVAMWHCLLNLYKCWCCVCVAVWGWGCWFSDKISYKVSFLSHTWDALV
jgi:hypothetical protein